MDLDILMQPQKTLVDQIEDALINYFETNGYKPGDIIPSETELANALQVGRPVLREALSRFKMCGMITCRTKRGSVLSEPSLFGGMRHYSNPRLMNDSTLLDILEFRIALEIGISNTIFQNITEADIRDLKDILKVEVVIGDNKYSPISEFQFHAKLYEITGNKIIQDFQTLIHPILDFVKNKYKDIFNTSDKEFTQQERVTHYDLLNLLINKDIDGYKKAIENHFSPYIFYLKRLRGSSDKE